MKTVRFVIFVNGLSVYMSSLTFQFVTLPVSDNDFNNLNINLDAATNSAEDWFTSNKFLLYREKTTSISFTSSIHLINLHKGEACYLGITFDTLLTWEKKITKLSSKLSTKIYGIQRITTIIDINVSKSAYYPFFHSVMVYGILAWDQSHHTIKILKIQKRPVRDIDGVSRTNTTTVSEVIFMSTKLEMSKN